MKILWICNILLPEISDHLGLMKNYTGGWLVGLSENLSKNSNVELSIAFPLLRGKEITKYDLGNKTYFSVPIHSKSSVKYDFESEKHLKKLYEIEQPDIIHIFGTEVPFSWSAFNAAKTLKVVVSIQGLVSIYSKHYYASLPNKIIQSATIREILKFDRIVDQRKKFEMRGEYEQKILSQASNIIGRTTWDLAITFQYNPDRRYYKCNETLRKSFYSKKWNINECEKYTIFLSQASIPIKGLHYVLDGLEIIKRFFPKVHLFVGGPNIVSNKSFKDRIYRSTYGKYIMNRIANLSLVENITFLGGLHEEEMANRYLKSHVFVCPSSIENSPNSLGEAMLLGVPSVASDVGGVIDLFANNIDGFIYQHDSHYMLAHYIMKIFEDDALANYFSENSRIHASITHSESRNNDELLNIYNAILEL